MRTKRNIKKIHYFTVNSKQKCIKIIYISFHEKLPLENLKIAQYGERRSALKMFYSNNYSLL